MISRATFLLLIFLSTFVFAGQTPLQDDGELGEYISRDKRFKFRLKYPKKGWVFTTEVKTQPRSRFKDLIVLKTANRINQIRLSTYKGLSAPDAKRVARMLEAEFVQSEIRSHEQYMKVRDSKMNKKLVKAAKAKEGWILTLSYYDRREGTLYNSYWIFYRKVVLPANAPGKPPLVVGRAYVIRVLVREKDYAKIIKDALKVIRSFKIILR